MSITKTLIEHEFLFRWDDAGKPKGAHIAYRQAFQEDGVEVAGSSSLLDPRPVNLSDADKLAEIGAAINAAALADNAEKAAQIEALTKEKTDAETARDSAVAQRDSAIQAGVTAQARITELEAKVKELTPPEPVSSTPT